MKIKIISDTHFFDNNVAEQRGYEGEVFGHNGFSEHTEYLIEKGNEAVEPNDIVVHLGDVADDAAIEKYPEKIEELKKIFKKLNGRKVLLTGNKDRVLTAKDRHFFHEIGFEAVERFNSGEYLPIHTDEEELGLSHEPLRNIPDYVRNVHGHVHNLGGDAIFKLWDSDPNKINVCGDNGKNVGEFTEVKVTEYDYIFLKEGDEDE